MIKSVFETVDWREFAGGGPGCMCLGGGGGVRVRSWISPSSMMCECGEP